MSEPYLILGKDGQLSNALLELLGPRAVCVGIEQANFAHADFISQLERATENEHFTAVLNAAAYTQVDKAEEEVQLAMRINGSAVGELAQWCKAKGLPLLHVSTEYVFAGEGTQSHKESDETAPLNVYGKSKLAGEQAIKESDADAMILRTSWLYDAHGKNFFTTMLRLFKEKETLHIVDDQIGAPTYVPHLALQLLKALQLACKQPVFPSGTYHLCSAGEASWYDFAKQILALALPHDSAIICKEINPIPSSKYPTPAARPHNSRLNCSKALLALGVQMPHWKDGLKECIGQVYESDERQHRGA